MVSNARSIIGVDLGGTKLAVALVNDRLGVLNKTVSPSAGGESPEECLANIYARLDEAVREWGPVDAIGVGTASMVNFRAGRIVVSNNLPLRDVPLRDLLAQRFSVPAVIDNDATVAALAEFRYGAGVGTSEMLMLTLGTGIGGGIICAGRPYRGFSGAAGEIGHMVIERNGPPCPGVCPNRGCLETFASGNALGERARATAAERPESSFGRAQAAGEPVDGPLASRLALAGDADAVALLTAVGEDLGVGIASLVNIFNPELVVVGGGAAQASGLLLDAARRVVAERALQPQRDEVRIAAAQHGPDAGVLGAAALAMVELFPHEEPPRG